MYLVYLIVQFLVMFSGKIYNQLLKETFIPPFTYLARKKKYLLSHIIIIKIFYFHYLKSNTHTYVRVLYDIMI